MLATLRLDKLSIACRTLLSAACSCNAFSSAARRSFGLNCTPCKQEHAAWWGDTEEDEDVLPDNTETGPTDEGIITKTEYYHKAKGVPMKQTTKVQLVKI